MAYATVFVVSDDPAIRDSFSELITSTGLRVEAFPSVDMWLAAVERKRHGCLLLDARAHDFDVGERLGRLRAVFASLPVLLLIDRGDVQIAVQAMREGAADVLEKPLRDDKLLQRIQLALAARRPPSAAAAL